MNNNTANRDFFILTAPRSGSTVLVTSLDKHPQIFCAGELFHASNKIYHPEWHFNFWGKKNEKGFLRTLFSVTNFVNGYLLAVHHIKKFYSTRNEKEIRGFKLMISHAKDFQTVWKYLIKNNFRIIVLIRRNTFLEGLSAFRAKKLGFYHSGEEHSFGRERVTINAALLKKRVDELEAVNAYILQLSKNCNRIVIAYEEFEAWQQMLNKVFDFLEVEKISIQPQLKKLSSGNWRDGVTNYMEIENLMKENYADYIN